MKNIKVLGMGCANCKTTVRLIEEVVAEYGAEVQLEKVEDIKEIVGYGVLATPAVVIDGQVVHSGGIPTKDKIKQWLIQS